VDAREAAKQNQRRRCVIGPGTGQIQARSNSLRSKRANASRFNGFVWHGDRTPMPRQVVERSG